jgi:chorismate mutase / prephenate dehydrogenase
MMNDEAMTNLGRPEELLEQHRRDIEALDRRILHLVCERLALARQVGELKNRLGVPLRNFEVETQVLERFREASRFLGLEPSLGHDLALFLIQKAVEEQATLRDVQYQGDALDTVVIGGKGGMGRWIARFLAGQGHRVQVLDPSPDPTPFPELRSLAEAASSDLIMIAVPMSVCPEVLEHLVAVQPRGVVAEMCSFKAHLAPVLERVGSQGGLRVVSFHPLFGPDVRMLSERTIVFCSDGRRQDIDFVRRLFENTSARLVEMDIEEHDRRMALVLGLTHLSNLVYARALSRSGVPAADMAEVAGVTFQKQMRTTREVVAENPALYYEIQALNALTPELGQWLGEAVQEWLAAVAAGDGSAFERLMDHCRQALEHAERQTSPGLTTSGR